MLKNYEVARSHERKECTYPFLTVLITNLNSICAARRKMGYRRIDFFAPENRLGALFWMGPRQKFKKMSKIVSPAPNLTDAQ